MPIVNVTFKRHKTACYRVCLLQFKSSKVIWNIGLYEGWEKVLHQHCQVILLRGLYDVAARLDALLLVSVRRDIGRSDGALERFGGELA